MYKNVLIVYFSGTGNTRLYARNIANHFKKYDLNVDVFEYDNKLNINNIDINKYDLIGIGYPIHAFNVVKSFYLFLKTFPKINKNIDYFIFKTSGEPFKFNSCSSYRIYKLFKKKGFNLILEKHLLMPYNIMFRYKDSVVKQLYSYVNPLSELIVMQIMNHDINKIRYNPFYIFISWLFRIEYLAPIVNYRFCKINQLKCDNCYLCLKSCPSQAIYINSNNKIDFNKNCCLCMRCTMYCPNDAIVFGFLNNWKVSPNYNFEKIKKDKNINDYYINPYTKGYFKLFYKYFKKQDDLLKKYHIVVN